MEAFIAGLIAAALGPVRNLAQAAMDRIRAVYDALTGALGRVRSGFWYWLDRTSVWAAGQVRHARATATHLAWMLYIELPRRIAGGVGDATRWAADRVAWAIDLARADLAAARAWLTARISEALANVLALRDWVFTRIGELRVAANALLDRVFGVLSTPESLVSWILGPLISALAGWAMDNLTALAEIAWRRRRVYQERAMSIVDDIVDRIL